ncbi:TPA: radical SAM protein [Candidatus Poribacteria bacterium]|nr:radical SAM protein [Candidatus Poribacteria bacterium]
MNVALVNTNRIKPPIAPIGLEYIAEAMNEAGHRVEILDLCWEDDLNSAIAEFLEGGDFRLVGLTLRNTDDCVFTSRHSFLDEFAHIVEIIRQHTDAVILVGGVGFSTMPEQVLDLCGLDVGVWGEGEFVLPRIADRMERGEEWLDLPNLIWHDDEGWRRNPSSIRSPLNLPPMSRSWVDNRRYFREGGQAGIETKRGCSCRCIYCADPVAKGKSIRLRTPESVVLELERLLDQGIDHVHTCDSEFNLPQWHAIEVCREIIRRGLGGRLRWYAYCSPVPFSPELARLMRRAGCVGINFGVDNGDEAMLKRLKRDFSPDDIINAAHLCRKEGMAVMFDLLLGSPGETEESLKRTIELMRRADPDRVGVAVGVRVYPGTELSRLVFRKGMREGLIGGDNPADPLFFLEPSIAPILFDLLDDLIGEDRRFFFFDPAKPERNYNYNANQLLVEAIRRGYRGAYWDILRRFDGA